MKVKVNQYMINFNTAVGLNIILSCFCCILFNVPFVSENIHQLWYYLNVTNCKFESNSKQGLQIHIKKKHGEKFECDQCEKVFESETEKNLHRKTHSFKS